jgi:hypothetical protein
VRKRDLTRKIKRASDRAGLTWEKLRDSGDHEVWALDGKRVSIPRHNDINESTAEGIQKHFEDKLGEDWWR